MSNLNILLVEDNDSDISTFESSLEFFEVENGIKIDLSIAKDFETAVELVHAKIFDGIVLDLSLKNSDLGGKQIIDNILQKKMIIPIIVYTGTPDDISEYQFIDVYRKGEAESVISEILNDLKKTKDFGFNDIFNAKGEIQEFLKDVFYQNIYHQKKHWIKYSDKESVKKAILRHTLNHLTQHIDQTDNKYFLEEMYIYPPIDKSIKTGSIVKNLSENQYHIVLTPACDFAQSKARCILLAEIIEPVRYISTYLPGDQPTTKRKDKLKPLIANKKQEFHYLPQFLPFLGGFIDFTSVRSYSLDELQEQFSEVKIQISPYFISDILGRFSSYYARQGQPDLHHEDDYIIELLSINTASSN